MCVRFVRGGYPWRGEGRNAKPPNRLASRLGNALDTVVGFGRNQKCSKDSQRRHDGLCSSPVMRPACLDRRMSNPNTCCYVPVGSDGPRPAAHGVRVPLLALAQALVKALVGRTNRYLARTPSSRRARVVRTNYSIRTQCPYLLRAAC